MANGISSREAFGKALVEMGATNPRIVVLDADLASSTKVDMFGAKYPDRYFEVGIAEQNMVGIAAGLATMGFIPFTSTFACFASKRVLDQIRVVVAQPKNNVKITAHYSGLLAGKTGKTHQSVMDISIMRAMPHMTVIVPGDGIEARKATYAAAEFDGPVYLRLTRDASPVVFEEDYDFQIGKAVTLREGTDVTIITTGLMVGRAIEARETLTQQGISAHILHMPTIKPFDTEAVVKAAQKTGLVVTAEENNILGGLGGAVAEVLGENAPLPIKRVGLNDTFGETGSNEAMLTKYGLMPADIAKACRDLLGKYR